MMTRQQYMLTKLAEECSEVSQIALKAQQFGLTEVMPGQPFNNAERCHHELDDLMAVVEVLNQKYGLGYVPDRARVEAKFQKLEKYLDYSTELGLVSRS